MYSKVQLIYLIEGAQDHDRDSDDENPIQYWENLHKAITDLGYSINITECYIPNNSRSKFDIKLSEALKINDFVITVGLNRFVFQTLSDIINQGSTDNPPVINKAPIRYMRDAHSRSPILTVYNLFLVDEDLDFHSNTLMIPLVKYLDRMRKPGTYTLIYTMLVNIFLTDFIKKQMKAWPASVVFNVTPQNDFYELTVKSSSLEVLNIQNKELIKLFKDDIHDRTYFMEYEAEVMKCEDHHILKALKHINECFQKYRPERVCISFNGGKDCTVLLYLVMTVLKKRYPDLKTPFVCIYIKSENTFKEVNNFVDEIRMFYHLKTLAIKASVKDGLERMLKEEPHLEACFMGTRKTDPYSEDLAVFKMTDPDWPKIMRVSPLLDWDYNQIWDFLLKYKVPYCSLYDDGYTSIGDTNNTVKNPYLKNGANKQEFFPAYKLLNGKLERSGRT